MSNDTSVFPVALLENAVTGPITYQGEEVRGFRRKYTQLQVADNLVYETMKLLLNQKYDPARPEHIALKRMKRRIESIQILNKSALESLVHNHP
jgi:hypothetical protein